MTGIEPAPSWSQTKRLTIRQHPEIYSIFLSTMVKPVVRPILSASARGDFLAFPPFFARLLAFLKITAENDCMLPKQARYQLRYIPMKYLILICCKKAGWPLRHPRLRRQLAVPDISMFCLAAKRNIDRCANKSSLNPPQAALGCVAQSRRAVNCASVATKVLSAFARLTCHSLSCCHALFLASSATGSARNRSIPKFTVPVACYVTGTIIIIQTLLKSQGVYDDLLRKDSKICSVKTL